MVASNDGASSHWNAEGGVDVVAADWPFVVMLLLVPESGKRFRQEQRRRNLWAERWQLVEIGAFLPFRGESALSKRCLEGASRCGGDHIFQTSPVKYCLKLCGQPNMQCQSLPNDNSSFSSGGLDDVVATYVTRLRVM